MSAERVPSEGANSEGGVVPELTDAVEAEAVSSPVPELSTGQKLRAARESRGWTTDHVAKVLKLSIHQVEALEADDWASLPCNTIIRGFIRNYARLLNLNSAELMAALDSLRMPKGPELEMPQSTNVKVPHDGGAQRRDYFSVITGVAVLALAVLTYFFLPETLWQSAVSALKSATQSVAVAPPSTATPEEVPPKQAVEMTSPSAIVLNGAAAPAATSTQASPSAQTSGSIAQPDPSKTPGIAAASPTDSKLSTGNVLKMSFSQPSWVEIRDRSGEIIFSQLCQAGSQREVEGRPPFLMIVGNATHVTVQYKGKPVDLSKRSKDDVARVTVE